MRAKAMLDMGWGFFVYEEEAGEIRRGWSGGRLTIYFYSSLERSYTLHATAVLAATQPSVLDDQSGGAIQKKVTCVSTSHVPIKILQCTKQSAPHAPPTPPTMPIQSQVYDSGGGKLVMITSCAFNDIGEVDYTRNITVCPRVLDL